MEAQIEQAIEIAWDPRSDQTLKSQALDFVHQLRTNPQGWQACFALALRDPRPSDAVRVTCLDVVNHAIRDSQLSDTDLAHLHHNMLAYIQNVYGHGTSGGLQVDPVSVQNKITQTVTNLFRVLYATMWASFFHDILGLTATTGSSTKDNIPGIMLYLRILCSIHDEIAETLVPRLPEEKQRDNDLKDLIRQRDVHMVAASWHEILAQWRSKHDSILEWTLRCVGRWVSWIDVSLAVNDSLLNLLFDLITQNNEGSKHLAIETFIEILGKKMGASDKLELIDVLKINEAVSELCRSRSLSEMRPTSDYDTDLAEDVAKLVNNTVCDIVRVLDTAKDGESVSLHGNSQLKAFLPHILRFLSDEYDEVCSTVIPCLTDLLTMMRKKVKSGRGAPPNYAEILPLILDSVVAKTKYDETSLWGNEDTKTDEAEFQELRKRLHVLQQAVAQVDETMYIEKIRTLVVSTFEKYQSLNGQLDWREVDLAMHELFLFGDLAFKRGALYSKTKAASLAAEQLIRMLSKLVESDIASFSHPAIQLQYMENCVRYYQFFENNPQLITSVLEHFVRLVHHDHIKVRTRSWYLFQRFVKHVRQHISGIAETMINALEDLLSIEAELPEESAENENEDLSSSQNDQTANARFNSQLYLYEAVGCICSARGTPVENQVVLVRNVINPLFLDLEAHLALAETGDKRATLQVHHLILALGTLARGFSDWTPSNNSPDAAPPASATSEEFARAAEAILVALERLKSSFEIREAARFAFSRLIGVLGNRILPQLPRWIDGLLSRTSTKDEMAMFMKLLDQVVFGFKSEIYNMLSTLLIPFLERVFAGIGEPVTGTDDEIQLAELKREYMAFLLVILSNNLEAVLVNETNQSMFNTVISTIEHFAKDVTDFQTAKLAFGVLTRMVSTWGGPDLASQPQLGGNALNSSAQPSLPGFDRFMMERFSPLCWAMPTNPNFDCKDAQGQQVLGEAASLQKAIYTKTGQEYLTWLRDVELSGMGMEIGAKEQYLNALSNSHLKAFQQYFKNLVSRSPQ